MTHASGTLGGEVMRRARLHGGTHHGEVIEPAWGQYTIMLLKSRPMTNFATEMSLARRVVGLRPMKKERRRVEGENGQSWFEEVDVPDPFPYVPIFEPRFEVETYQATSEVFGSYPNLERWVLV